MAHNHVGFLPNSVFLAPVQRARLEQVLRCALCCLLLGSVVRQVPGCFTALFRAVIWRQFYAWIFKLRCLPCLSANSAESVCCYIKLWFSGDSWVFVNYCMCCPLI